MQISTRALFVSLLLSGVPSLIAGAATAQLGTVMREQKISATQGGFGGALVPLGGFGRRLARIGDLDGNGTNDLAASLVPEPGSTEPTQGAFWILFLASDGSVVSERKIGEGLAGFEGNLDAGDYFASSLALLGDIDGDGTVELAVGASGDDDGGTSSGAVWILHVAPDGSVAGQHKISATQGGFGGTLAPFDFFGAAVARVGDLDADGIAELAVGASGDDDGGTSSGAVWILFLRPDASVRAWQKISGTEGDFGAGLEPADNLGVSLAALGDLDGDGVHDLAVGAYDGSPSSGAVWIVFLERDGTVAAKQKIAEGVGGFTGPIGPGEFFGISLASPGDLDGDGTRELAVGEWTDNDAGPFSAQGAVWILFLEPDGSVRSEQKINGVTGGFSGDLDNADFFGHALADLGDLDGDGAVELAVGAYGDDDGGTNQGAVWVLFLESSPCLTLDFETDDDLVSVLENGQALSSPPEFGTLVHLTGLGPNAGAAVFDSTMGGPNDPAVNADMLIGQGNVLLLQSDAFAAQSRPGFFDVVTDDDGGGDLVFDFRRPVEPRSVLLADINPPPNRGASVTLFDDAGRARVYAVEPGWTGPYGDAGPHRLDLTRLDPQPGNGTPRYATATEEPGFAPDRVIQVVVRLTGFGAIDELSVCVTAQARGAVATRNGSGTNRMALSAGSPPRPGTTWSATLDCTSTGPGTALLEGRAVPLAGTPTPFGEILIGGDVLVRLSRRATDVPVELEWRIPFDLALVGRSIHAQGLCAGTEGAGPKLRESRMTLSNALDLVVGF